MRILIVEDDKQIVEIYKETLSDEGYAVDSAYTGEEGEILVETIPYDLILLDVVLPGKNGFEVCRNLRCKKIETPIMMISGRMKDDPAIIQGLDWGADEYLTKPVRLGVLSAQIRALLRKKQNTKNTRLQIGNLVINTVYKQVYQGEKEIALIRSGFNSPPLAAKSGVPVPKIPRRSRRGVSSKKEYAILEYLAYHPNMIVSRAELQQHVWNFDQDMGSNVVDEHIKNLPFLIHSKPVMPTNCLSAPRISIKTLIGGLINPYRC